MNIKLKRIILFLCVIACMVAIFIFSSQNANISGKLSGGITHRIAEIFVKDFSEMNTAKQTEIVEGMHFYIRKAAHFTIYAVLGFFMLAAVSTYKIKISKKFIITFLFCLAYASSDEIHQLFTNGRCGSPRDVLIDFCGSVTGSLVSFGISCLYKKVSKKD